LIIIFGWVLFSAESLSVAWMNFMTMMKFNFEDISAVNFVTNKEWFFFAVAILIAFFPETESIKRLERFVIAKGVFALLLLVYASLQLAAGGFNPFIYFRF
jgi:hypothetical protein